MSAPATAPADWARFNNSFDLHAKWRRSYAMRLQVLADWLRTHELVDDAVQDKLQQLEQQLRSDKLMVAFVAEFSRGKSELINAIFFAAYGQRIMPASAGRTTMCPTELGWDASAPPCLRLLPIETRLQPQALLEWRSAPETWTQVDLDVGDAQQLAQAIEKVAELIAVTVDQARALGFWHDERPEDNPPVDAQGMVEVPRWRHALINIAHPLLKQGLVILDTPGLNAIGAEPELTVSLIPQADAAVFILGADTGVTKSDLEIWREHLVANSEAQASRLVVLNKVDGLWDELSTAEQVARSIQKQCDDTARTLGLSAEQVLPVSAQKGLLAKVQGDTELLRKSGLPVLEQALSETILERRHEILQAQATQGLRAVRDAVRHRVHMQDRERTEQQLELTGLRGKNSKVIKHMRVRVLKEQDEFSQSGSRIHAMKSVHMQMLQKLFEALSSIRVQDELGFFAQALQQSSLKLGVKKVYEEAFRRLDGLLAEAEQLHHDVHNMLQNSFKQINTEFGFSLQLRDAAPLNVYRNDLQKIHEGHLRYLGVNNLLRLSRPEFVERLLKSLSVRLRGVFDAALFDVEQWNKDAAAQLDAQVRERRRSFAKRLEAIERIQEAAGALEERIQELEHDQRQSESLAQTLDELIGGMLDAEAQDPFAALDAKKVLISD